MIVPTDRRTRTSGHDPGRCLLRITEMGVVRQGDIMIWTIREKKRLEDDDKKRMDASLFDEI